MSSIPTCQPDGPKVRALIRERGDSVADFARRIGRPYRSIWNIINSRPTSIPFIRQVARGLRVKPGDISDWTADDDIWDDEGARLSA